MKLTNTIRDGIIAAIMNDVPEEDYVEIIRKMCQDFAVFLLPADLRVAYKKHPHYFQKTPIWLHGSLPSVYVVGHDSNEIKRKMQDDTAFWDGILSFQVKIDHQNVVLRELRARIHGALYGCSTLKQAQEALPDFVSYMPTEADPNRCLPVINNPIAEFRAAGFPKDKKTDKKITRRLE